MGCKPLRAQLATAPVGSPAPPAGGAGQGDDWPPYVVPACVRAVLVSQAAGLHKCPVPGGGRSRPAAAIYHLVPQPCSGRMAQARWGESCPSWQRPGQKGIQRDGNHNWRGIRKQGTEGGGNIGDPESVARPRYLSVAAAAAPPSPSCRELPGHPGLRHPQAPRLSSNGSNR